MEEEEKKALNEDRKVNLVEVLVTEVTDEGKFYGCTMSDGPAPGRPASVGETRRPGHAARRDLVAPL